MMMLTVAIIGIGEKIAMIVARLVSMLFKMAAMRRAKMKVHVGVGVGDGN